MRHRAPFAAALAAMLLPVGSAAHAPSVLTEQTGSPDEAVVLDDPTLSRAIGATLEAPARSTGTAWTCGQATRWSWA